MCVQNQSFCLVADGRLILMAMKLSYLKVGSICHSLTGFKIHGTLDLSFVVKFVIGNAKRVVRCFHP